VKVLLVEDERRIADFVCEGLGARGLFVEHVDNGHAGYARAADGQFDIVILDIMLPGRDGLSILSELRKKSVTTPIILLTARNELGDRVKGLDLGADDYLAKPFYVEELVSRIHALVRRDHQSALQVGDIRLDRVSRQATIHDQSIDLTGREFSLLEYLMRSPGEVFTRAQMLEHVWGYDFDPSTNVVDVCVKRIRAKLDEFSNPQDGKSPIEAVRGSGYRFKA
jgi:DNA-binding response OmpR family regulator